jgi:hypothetical protein
MINPSIQNLKHASHPVMAIPYRCNRCLSLENVASNGSGEMSFIVPCSKCSGLAIRLPISDSLADLFEKRGNPS